MIFPCVGYLMILWTILSDLFRDKKTNGWLKALWVIALIIFPLITALVYLIARGKGMQERKLEEMKDMQAMQEKYIKEVAASSSSGQSATDQIASAKQLLDSGAISQEEFDALKAKALG